MGCLNFGGVAKRFFWGIALKNKKKGVGQFFLGVVTLITPTGHPHPHPSSYRHNASVEVTETGESSFGVHKRPG